MWTCRSFFDRVNHDILIERLSKRVNDAGVIRLVRACLNAGIMDGGVVIERKEGTPQGGPLSPLLANVLLDEVDRALERKGHRFVRYADDCNVDVRSRKAGERVMRLLRCCYDKLPLKINETKRAVTGVFGRKFHGYALWRAGNGEVRRGVSKKALETFRQRIRQLTRRNGGRSMAEVIERLRGYLLGWKGVLWAGANAQCLAQARRVDTPTPACPPTEAVAAGQDDLPGAAQTWGQCPGGAIGGGLESPLVA